MNSSPSSEKPVAGAAKPLPRIRLFRTPPDGWGETLFPVSFDGFAETPAGEAPGQHVMEPDLVFYASLLTSTCHRFPVAEMISRFLAEKLGLNEAFAQVLHTALQELLMNAVIHGNLEMKGRFEDGESFSRYCEQVEARLADSRLAARRVKVRVARTPKALTLRVAQEGLSFAWNREPQGMLYQGRGISLIRACGGMIEAGDGEREVSVTFRLEDDAPEKTADVMAPDELSALQRARILLVDDAEFNVIMLQEVLGSRGFRNCMKALDGEKALEMTLAHKPD
ncbi:MAG: ATP-binding protein, partial [Alphaproteobacteria bacterium]|nr:ATP-binding protein [Alphaproteobacteria bacterium]